MTSPNSGLGVPGVMHVHADGQQAFAAPLAAAGENGAAALRFHAGAEPELPFPGALGRLVSAFHKK